MPALLLSSCRPCGTPRGTCGTLGAALGRVGPTGASLLQASLRHTVRRTVHVRAAAADAHAPAHHANGAGNGGPAPEPLVRQVNGVAAAAPTPVAAPPAPLPELAPPPKAYDNLASAGAARAALPAARVLGLGILAGVHIGMGGLLLLSVGAACPGLAASNPGLQKMVVGSFGLPLGLVLVMVCGAELFTGNVVMLTAAVREGKATVGALLRNWVLSFIGNFAGALGLAGLAVGAGLLVGSPGAQAIAVAKTSLTFTQAFCRAVIANWMVCAAVLMAGAASSLPGKFVAAWLAVSAFTAIGAEHSVANMLVVPMGIAAGAPVTFSKFLTANLLPVTLGNIVGGVALGLAYGAAFGRKGGATTAAAPSKAA